MVITLPDKSKVSFNPKTGGLRSIDGTNGHKPRPTKKSRKLHEIVELMARNFQRPSLPLEECFRRICDTPRYSPIRAKHDFSITIITRCSEPLSVLLQEIFATHQEAKTHGTKTPNLALTLVTPCGNNRLEKPNEYDSPSDPRLTVVR
jgi:hypothetical protein